MALLRDVIFKRGPSLATLIKEERLKLNIKGVQRVTIRFDPFGDRSAEIRKFASLLHSRVAVKSNLRCTIKTEILTDRSDGTVTFDLIDGKQFIFKCANLKCLEIFKLMNQHITPLSPQEVEVSAPAVKAAQKRRK